MLLEKEELGKQPKEQVKEKQAKSDINVVDINVVEANEPNEPGSDN